MQNPTAIYGMKTEEQIRKECTEIQVIIRDKGASPEVEGMELALRWVLEPTSPNPAQYARMVFGIPEETPL